MDCDQKTDINNMAITFGPNLMWAPLKLQSANTAVAIQKQQMVIKGLLENANYLFDISDKSRRSSRVSVWFDHLINDSLAEVFTMSITDHQLLCQMLF